MMIADEGKRIKDWLSVDPNTLLSDVIRQGRILLQEYPHNTELLLRLSVMLARAGNIPDALDLTRRLLALDPENTAARLNKSQLMMAIRRPRAALNAINDVLKRSPETPQAQELRGRAEAAIGKEEGVAEAQDREGQKTNLISGLFYILAKLLNSPRDEAIDLLKTLHLGDLEGDAAESRAKPTENTIKAGIGELDGAVAALAMAAYPKALRHLRNALDIYTAIIETGDFRSANALTAEAVVRLLDSSWRVSDLVSALAAGVVTTQTGQSPMYGLHSRLGLFCSTNESYTELLHWAIAQKRPSQPDAGLVIDNPGILGVGNPDVLNAALDSLNQDGYHNFGQRLPADVIERLTAYANTATGEPVPARNGKNVRFDPNDPELGIFFCRPQDVLELPDVQKLLCDPSYLAVARSYLGCEPMFATVNLWWSMPMPPSIEREAETAQMFHFDADWTKFINFFTYITDVDETSGPHVYVRGSHRLHTKPASLLSKGYARITDEQICQYYRPEDVIRVSAGPGTVLAGNTRCWHRGSRPTHKPRLMLEFIFTSSPVNGANKGFYDLDPNRCSPEFLAMVQKLPQVYQRMKIAAS